MRITNQQRDELKDIIKRQQADITLFNISGEVANCKIKYLHDYFEFAITKSRHSSYECRIKDVTSTNTSIRTLDWDATKTIFQNWLSDVVQEIKHTPPPPKKIEEKTFPKIIEAYSQNFSVIYNQALTAESIGLTEICGLGYRKAFEFLIKDYLIKKTKRQEHKAIKELQIARCIDEYITNDEIKLLTHRVLWLGNDHAHYIKKWKGSTIDDLKKLINLTIEWICIKDELDRVRKAMPQGKNKRTTKRLPSPDPQSHEASNTNSTATSN